MNSFLRFHTLLYQISYNLQFIEVSTDDKPNTYATIIQKSTNHVATLPTGHIGYIEVPITNKKPKYYQVNDITTLIHNDAHTYHPEITELIPQTNYNIILNQFLLISSHHIKSI